MSTGKLPDALDGVSTGCELNLDPRLPHIRRLAQRTRLPTPALCGITLEAGELEFEICCGPCDLDTCPKSSRPAPHNFFGEFDRLESIRTPRSRVLLAGGRRQTLTVSRGHGYGGGGCRIRRLRRGITVAAGEV